MSGMSNTFFRLGEDTGDNEDQRRKKQPSEVDSLMQIISNLNKITGGVSKNKQDQEEKDVKNDQEQQKIDNETAGLLMDQDKGNHALFKWLVDDQGMAPDAANYIVQRTKQTGSMDTSLPSFQNDLTLQHPTLPENSGNMQTNALNHPVALPPVPGIPERSTLQNFGPERQEAVGGLDMSNPDNPKLTLLPVPKNVNLKSTFQFNRPEKPTKERTPDQADYLVEMESLQKKFNADPNSMTDEDWDDYETASKGLGVPPLMKRPQEGPSIWSRAFSFLKSKVPDFGTSKSNGKSNPITRVLNGKTYTYQDGQWYEE